MSDTESTYTAREQLAEVDAAIQKILVGGQSYKLGSRSLTRADLSLLQQMRKDLLAQIAGEEDDGRLMPGTAVAVFEGR